MERKPLSKTAVAYGWTTLDYTIDIQDINTFAEGREGQEHCIKDMEQTLGPNTGRP
jgi:hypothetical protein